MARRVGLIVLLTCSVVAPALGQETTQVLVPLWLNAPAAGAHDSLWTTELAIVNGGEDPLVIAGYFRPDCGGDLRPCFESVPPGITFRPRLLTFTNEVQGIFLLLEREQPRAAAFSLRVRDLSRSVETWGTEIPVVRIDEIDGGPIHILDVPIRGGFRTMLRIYDLDPRSGPARVRVRVYGFNEKRQSPFEPEAVNDALLADEEHAFRYAVTGGGTFDHPGYIELADFPSRIITHFYHVRLRIDPLTPGRRIWAFASITNNATQHVTIMSPQ